MAKKTNHESDTPQPASNTTPDITRLHLWQVQAVRDFLWVAAVIALIWLGYALQAVTVPLLVALLLAYLCEPLILKLCAHRRISRAAAVSFLLGGILTGVLILLAVVIPAAVGQTAQLASDFRSGELGAKVATVSEHVPEVFQDQIDSFLEFIPGFIPTEPDISDASDNTASDTVSNALTTEEVRSLIREELSNQDTSSPSWGTIARGGLDAVLGIVGMILQVGLLLFLIPFYFFFFSMWYDDVLAFLTGLIPDKNKKHTVELISKMDQVVSGFVRGRIIISMLVGLILAIGWFICGVPYAIPIGLITGAFFIVPYLGGIGLPVAIVMLLFEHLSIPVDERTILLGTLGVFLWPTLVFGVVQFVESYVLTPAIAGKATNLDPVTLVVAVLAGGSLMGVYGMLLSIPAAACIKILITHVVAPKVRAWMKGEVEDPLPIGRD